MTPSSRGSLYLILSTVLVGTVVAASAVVGRHLPPFLIAALRLGLAAAVLVPLAWRHRAALRVGRHDAAILGLQALCGTVGFTVLTQLALHHTSAVVVSVVTGSLPAMVALVARLVLGERLDARRVVCVALATVGVVVVQLAPVPDGVGSPVLGSLCALAAVAGEAAFLMLGKALRRPPPPIAIAAAMSVLGAVAALPFAVIEARGVALSSVPSSAWLALVYYAVGPTVLGFWLWFEGAARVSGGRAALCAALVPVVGLAVAALVLGEAIAPAQMVGAALVVAAIVFGRSDEVMAEPDAGGVVGAAL